MLFSGGLFATMDNGGIRYINNREMQDFPHQGQSTYSDTYIVQGRTDHFSLPTNVETNIVLSDYVSETRVSAYHLRWLRLDVFDISANLLDSALLSRKPPDISGLGMNFQFGFQLDCCTGTTDIYGEVHSLSSSPVSVPVPPAAWLMIFSLLSLRVTRRKYSSIPKSY